MSHEIIDHTADIQFKIETGTLEELFIESLETLTQTISTDKIKSKKKKEFEVEGMDLENLLYNFLEEALFLFDSENFLVAKVEEIEIDEKKLKVKATILGDSAEHYEIDSHIKAVTYNEMYVKKDNGKWICLVTLDV